MYFIVYAKIDSTALILTKSDALPSGAYRDYTIAPGQHSYDIINGYWDTGSNSRQGFYEYTGTFQQPSGQTYTLNVTDPTIVEILTNFGAFGDRVMWQAFPCNNGYCTYCFNTSGGYNFWYDPIPGLGSDPWSSSGTYTFDHRAPTYGMTYFNINPSDSTGWAGNFYMELDPGLVTIKGPTSDYATDYYMQYPNPSSGVGICPASKGAAPAVPVPLSPGAPDGQSIHPRRAMGGR
jgi:hypothetical protein